MEANNNLHKQILIARMFCLASFYRYGKKVLECDLES